MSQYTIKEKKMTCTPPTYYFIYHTWYTPHLLKNTAQSKSYIRFFKQCIHVVIKCYFHKISLKCICSCMCTTYVSWIQGKVRLKHLTVAVSVHASLETFSTVPSSHYDYSCPGDRKQFQKVVNIGLQPYTTPWASHTYPIMQCAFQSSTSLYGILSLWFLIDRQIC